MNKKAYLLLSLVIVSSFILFATAGRAQQYTLTVSKAGSGTGTITSSPAGVSCGSDCSEPYNQGTKITLKVKADPGSTFKGWSGGCTGTSASCKLIMNSDQTVTATFELPDLRGEWSSFSVKSSPAGYEVSGNLTVHADNAKASSVKANVYLSNDATYDSNDILLGSVTIGTINAGASKSKAFKYKGSNNPSGKCLIAVIDPDNTVKESNENNNTGVKCPPVANAGPDQTVFVTQAVTLDGSASSDIEGDPLKYQWSFVSRPEGSTAALSSSTAVNPSFTVDKAGTYTVQLIVNDGTFDSAPDTVNIVAQLQVWNLEVGPEGGTLIFGNGVKLQIPPGAVSETTTISISDLVADQITGMLSNPSMTSTHTKRFLGGFSAKPEGLVFAVPIQAWVPISPLDLYETPVQVELLMSEQRHRYASSQLEYSGDEAMIKIEISHFSDEAFAGLTGEQIDALCTVCGPFFYYVCEEFDPLQPACCLIPPKDRAACTIAANCECCREKRIKVESIGVDFALKGSVECQVLGSDLKVTFLDCLGAPTEKDSISESSCKDLELEIKVEPAEMTLCPGEEKQLKATVTGKKGGVTIFNYVSIDPIWTSDHPEIVEIDPKSGKVIGKAISSTPVTIHAKVSASSSVKEGTAQVTVNFEHCLSIDCVWVDEYWGKLYVEGKFSLEKGKVMVGGQQVSVEKWGQIQIKCDLPPDLAGDVYVEVNGEKSNVVTLTEWKADSWFKYTRSPIICQQLEPLPTITTTLDVHFRAVIHQPNKWLSQGCRKVSAAKGSIFRWESGGTCITCGDPVKCIAMCTETISGSGERIYDGHDVHDYFTYCFKLIWEIHPDEKKVSSWVLFDEFEHPVIGTTICSNGHSYQTPYVTGAYFESNLLLDLDDDFSIKPGSWRYPGCDLSWCDRIEWGRIVPKYPPKK